MKEIETKLQATYDAIADSEARLQRAWSNLARSATPEVQVERRVASRPHAVWAGAFAVGFTLGWLHGQRRRLPF